MKIPLQCFLKKLYFKQLAALSTLLQNTNNESITHSFLCLPQSAGKINVTSLPLLFAQKKVRISHQ